MLVEDQRFIHEDLERLEQGVCDRVAEEPRHIRDRLNRDHQIAGFLTRIQEQSDRLLEIYKDVEGLRSSEIKQVTLGDPFEEFYKQLGAVKDFHRRYPNEPAENLEKAYKRRVPQEGESTTAEIDNLFTGEEAYGRYLDLTVLHESFLNLPNNSRRINYLQYLQIFDRFVPPHMTIKLADKRTDQYFRYVGQLATYLEEFHRRTRPLEDLAKQFDTIDKSFEKAWTDDAVPGWKMEEGTIGPSFPVTQGSGEGIWCADCQKEFKNDNIYKAHLTGRKHIKAAAGSKRSTANGENGRNGANGVNGARLNGVGSGTKAISADASLRRLKDRAIAEREFRIARLAADLETVRTDTRINIERRQGMTERERQQELEAIFAETAVGSGPNGPAGVAGEGNGSDSEDEEKIYNPLKLPLAWDGKPIPYWLYKLHGLGVELPCEICGNFVYMGRRAFDRHFGEARHVYGLKCLGITNTTLFREITGIQDALKLWEKIQRDKNREDRGKNDVVQMEDAEGNVMPEKVYNDLQKQGLL